MSQPRKARSDTDAVDVQSGGVASSAGAAVVPLPFAGGDEELLDGIRAKSPIAVAALCDRYSAHVLRVLGRIVGADSELEDLHHEVFERALRSAAGVENANALAGWITIVSVNVARTELGRRARRRWLTLLPWYDDHDVEAPAASDEDVEALRRTYALLDRMAPDLRIVFALRFIDGMDLRELAAACDVSLATAKRRLARAESRFQAMARDDAVLAPWVERGGRWNQR
jgi:RNA polymerase sigma-70 factor, ECF subfamily